MAGVDGPPMKKPKFVLGNGPYRSQSQVPVTQNGTHPSPGQKSNHFHKSPQSNGKVFANGKANNNVNNEALKLLVKQRKALPIFPTRFKLIEQLKENDTVIVIGETGSGKTTQIPQYIHEERLDRRGMIGITQPRRVAAISVAKRVAEEMNTSVGGLVGYSVRFEEATSISTKVKYATDGMLLREAISDPLLNKYSWIVLDEAHERTISTDVLFGIVKDAQKARKSLDKEDLKIIVMSATMDVDHFSGYFGDAPVLYIEGRQFPIEVFYARKKQEDYVLASMSTIFQIHKEAPAQHDILLFLTGQEEIDAVVRTVRQISKDDTLSEYPRLRVYALYAAMPAHQQMDAFRPTSPGERKVIISTNIAETSITIPGIRYVVDSGQVKVRSYHTTSGFDVLKVQKISQAQAWQRAGRAGRETSGFCYRAFTLEEFGEMSVNSKPEILRSNLASVILQLLAIGVKNITNFDFIDKPSAAGIKQSVEQLKMLGAINQPLPDKLELTELGKKMAQFPLEPRYSKVILSGPDYGCTEEMLTIIALLSSESIFINPSGKKEKAAEVRKKFSSVEGDHITLLKIYRAFRGARESKLWCNENFLNYRNLLYAMEVRKQLAQVCHRCSVNLVSCQQKLEPVRKCLITGLFTNIAELQLDGKYITLENKSGAAIHPSSVLFQSKPAYILFTELVQTGKTYMHLNSIVDSHWLVEIAPDYFRQKHIKR